MHLTDHGRARANQRGFSGALLDLIATHGAWQGDRQTLGRRELTACLATIDAVRRDVLRLLDKGGGTAAFGEKGELITVFSPRTYRRNMRRSRQLRRA